MNLTLASGHIYGLLGKNGAGKTTLLKLMTGLLFAKEGCVKTLGEPAEQRKSNVLQDLYFLQEEMYVPHLKIKEFEKSYAPYFPKFSSEQFSKYLKEFEIDTEFGYVDKLSQGQKKKVLIAFALATNTSILLMDEPTNGLDIPAKTAFRKIMVEAFDENKLVVISTHQVRELHSLIDVVTLLENGEIILNSSTAEITDRLLFDIDNQKSDTDDILYSEETPRGDYQLKRNSQHIESSLDLELLFNGTLYNQNAIKEIFK
ncbi:MAG: ABC transporter ATP-binding protein [Bacteroidales bacterium]|nr:ABC transporter ATP-binding protein [Bacteroidales bacterium]